jgi:hypothetical protein
MNGDYLDMWQAGLAAGFVSFSAQALNPIRAVPTAMIARILNIVIFPSFLSGLLMPSF